MKLGLPICITWEDAWSDPGYFTIDEVNKEKAYKIDSFGVLVRNDKTGMYIAREIMEHDKRVRCVQHIPKGMIRKVRTLK